MKLNIKSFSEHLQANFPEVLAGKNLVACSGGVDSVILTHLCNELGLSIAIAHCNFRLRGNQSDLDEAFVSALAEKMGVAFFCQRFDTKRIASNYKISTQEAARLLRYQYFDEIVNTQGLDYILTAHQLDDSIETFVFHLSRGSGIEGFLGIPSRRDRIFRPLLPYSKNDILLFAKDENLAWREDLSNEKLDYTRNKIRHQLIPMFLELNPSFHQSMESTFKFLKQTHSLAEDASAAVLKQVVTNEPEMKKINIAELLKYPNYAAYLHSWLANFGFKSWKDIFNLPFGESGKRIMSEEFVIYRDKNELIVTKSEICDEINIELPEIPFELLEPIRLSVQTTSDFSMPTTNVVYFDAEKFVGSLRLRHVFTNDKFAPDSMINGTKSVGKFLRDEKLSLKARKATLVLADDQAVIWVIGYGRNRNYLATNQTKQIVKFSLIK